MAKRKKPGPSEVARRDGGHCAVFANSASAKRRGFSSYAELLAWGVRVGAVTAADAARLERTAAERPEDAAAVFSRALEARVWLRRILLALAARRTPASADVAILSEALAAALTARVLVQVSTGGWRWAWGDRGGVDLDRMLWPALLDAADVMTSKYYRQVGVCAGEGCDLIFVDRAPGSARRWCDKRACGAKVNSRRHYEQIVKRERRARKRGGQQLREHIEMRMERYMGRFGEDEEPSS